MIRRTSSSSARSGISRRLWLQGAGTTIALPAFESLLPREARAAAPPQRLLAYYVPCGINMRDWTPATQGAGYTAPPILAPLAAVAGDVSVLTGLCNRPAKPDGPGDHASGTAAFLTAAHPRKTAGANIQNGISMDQVAATRMSGQTLFPSLQLGIDPGGAAGDCDSGYSCAYTSNISWSGPATPVAKLTDPQAVFDRLFAGIDPGLSKAERDKRLLYRTSVLDFARGRTDGLRARMGVTDQRKLDEYMTGVRELENRIALAAKPLSCTPPARPAAAMDYPGQMKLMADLMVLAFNCDLTRVITFMLGNAGSNRSYPFLGIPDGHHQLSHHQMNPATLAKLTIIDTWEIQQFAYLLQQLKAIAVGGGSLLDNTAVVFSSEIEDGDTHSHLNLPVLLAGRAGGVLHPGRHVVYANAPSIASLFVSLLGAVGAPVDTFGDATTPLPNL